MKNILKISAAAAAMTLALSGCIKDATPTQIATEDQVTLETLVRGIPAALVMYNSTGYAQDGAAWDFSLPAIHLATESMTGDLVVTGNIGYDWFTQWGTNVSLGSDYAVGALTWDNYYTWIMMANNVIKQIDASDFSSLDATQRSYLGFAYTYRAMFYLDLVRLYEFKENTVTEAPELLGLGVPVVLPETTEAEAKNNPRAKVDDIYDKVIFPDLDNAEELLENYTAPDKYTISLALVYGLKARAWLERGTAKNDAESYRQAAEYARLAITASGCTPLTQEQWEDPTNGFNSATPSRRRHLLQGVAGRLRQHQVPPGAGRLCRLQGGRRGRPLLHARRGDVLHRGRGHGAGRRPGRRHPPAQRVHDLLPHDERRDLRLHEQVGNARRVH